MLSQDYRDQTKIKKQGHKRGKPENVIKVVNRTGNSQKVESRERKRLRHNKDINSFNT